MDRSKEAILEELAQEEVRLGDLDRALEATRARVERLRSELSAAATPPPPVLRLPVSVDASAPRTAAEKVKLFRSLFRGRPDIFPTRFVSKKTGRRGYAPACSNKWEIGLCGLKTGGKCSDRANQAFLAVDDAVIADHLRGRHVMRVYPLLEDESCWFLAADFDKSSWKEDIAAFAETCRGVGVPVAIERSRSGNGAHAWFFFEAAVSAGYMVPSSGGGRPRTAPQRARTRTTPAASSCT